jgi:monoamine oxidase
VLIVGAGIAGLTAAFRLHQQGIAVRVVEGQDRVGGRMFSLRGFFPDGQVAELGGELVDTGHGAIRALAGELGLVFDDFLLDDPALDRDAFFFEGRRVPEHEVVRAFVPLSDLMLAELATLEGDDVTFREPNGGERLDHTRLSDWLASAEIEGWFRRLIDVAYTTEYGLETVEQSVLNLLLLLDPNPMPFRIFGDSDERLHVRGGNDLIPRGLAERLGDRVETGTRVEAISRRADGSYVVALRRGETSEQAAADHVVVTVPFTMLRERADGGASIRLDSSLGIPGVQRRAIASLAYGTNAKLMVGFAERVWRRPEAPYRSNGSTLTDQTYQLCWETSRLQPGESGIVTNFTGGRHGVELGSGAPAEQAAAFASQLDRVFPGVAAVRGKEARFHWPTHPWTLGSYACYRPGDRIAFAGEEGRRVGNLHFAGEHTSSVAQGFMEGGCESGERVAAEVLQTAGVRVTAERGAR